MTTKNTTRTTTSIYKKQLSKKFRPQDDFFNHVNSKWLKANPIPPSESRWGQFNVLRDHAWQNLRNIYEELQQTKNFKPGSVEQQARDLYYTGMHVDDFENVHMAFVNNQLTLIDSIQNTNDLAKVIGQMQDTSVSAPWRVIVDADDKNSAVHILRLAQGGLTLPDRDYYLEKSKKMQDVRAAYKAHLKKVFVHFPTLAPNAGLLVKTVLDFETHLAKISRSRAELRDVEKNYNKTKYSKLQKTYTNINWPLYAKAIGWKPDDKISVDQPEFFVFMDEKFVTKSLDEWKTYLKWHFLKTHYSRISERFAKLKFELFGKVLLGSKEPMPLWKRVTLTIDDAMGEGVGKIYAKRHFSEASKNQVLDLVEDIREAYKGRIKALTWMGEPTKKYALKKLANMKVLIGYPDKWRDFSKLKIGRTSYLENIIAADQHENAYWFKKLHEPTSRDDWYMFPQTVNAYHDLNRLVICFPAAILQPPFFDSKALLAANLGGIGSVIGHEFTHGFDDQGSRFDAKGNAQMWQTQKERKEFDRRAKIIIDQADQFEVLPGVHMRGKLVIGESIADLGGLELAYHALHNKLGRRVSEPVAGGLTHEQILFINQACTECAHSREERIRQMAISDPHPQEQFRVNGILGHADAFYTTFGVTPQDKLYRPPKQRARIW